MIMLKKENSSAETLAQALQSTTFSWTPDNSHSIFNKSVITKIMVDIDTSNDVYMKVPLII